MYLDDINCDDCGIFLCKGFIDYADDSGFLCKKCEKKHWNEDARTKIKSLKSRVRDYQKRLKCQRTKEGHDWKDITMNCLVLGSDVFSCTKCGHQATVPRPMDNIQISSLDSIQMIDAHRLVFGEPGPKISNHPVNQQVKIPKLVAQKPPWETVVPKGTDPIPEPSKERWAEARGDEPSDDEPTYSDLLQRADELADKLEELQKEHEDQV